MGDKGKLYKMVVITNIRVVMEEGDDRYATIQFGAELKQGGTGVVDQMKVSLS